VTFEPGWRWSECVKPVAGTESCQARHVGVVQSGRLAVKHQEIDNFGASDCWTMQKIGVWSEASKNKIADLLFDQEKGIGLSLWRFNIGGGTNPNLPVDLSQQAANSPFFSQYCPGGTRWLCRPSDMPTSDLTFAFAPG